MPEIARTATNIISWNRLHMSPGQIRSASFRTTRILDFQPERRLLGIDGLRPHGRFGKSGFLDIAIDTARHLQSQERDPSWISNLHMLHEFESGHHLDCMIF